MRDSILSDILIGLAICLIACGIIYPCTDALDRAHNEREIAAEKARVLQILDEQDAYP